MTPDEFLNIVCRHERFVNGWVGSARADLSHQDFSGMRLTSVNLQNAQLRGINFSDCDLTGADFSGADLFRAQFERSISPATNFSGADLRGARFGSATLSGSHFRGADMRPGLRSLWCRCFQRRLCVGEADECQLVPSRCSRGGFSRRRSHRCLADFCAARRRGLRPGGDQRDGGRCPGAKHACQFDPC